MDPLAAPLSCPCVEGYAQRDYQVLADFIAARTGLATEVVFGESLKAAIKKTTIGRAHLVIGKDSVVRSDAARAKLKLQPVARLTGKDGLTTQTGLIIVRSDDPAQQLSDLKGYRFLLGPANAPKNTTRPASCSPTRGSNCQPSSKRALPAATGRAKSSNGETRSALRRSSLATRSRCLKAAARSRRATCA